MKHKTVSEKVGKWVSGIAFLISLTHSLTHPLTAFGASTTTVDFSVRTASNIPITNALISITALNPVISDGVTNLILGQTIQIRTGANGAVETNLVPQLYLTQIRNSIPYYAADFTNLIPVTNVTMNANDTIVAVAYIPSALLGYSQAQANERFLHRTNDVGTNNFTQAGYSNVLVRPRIFPGIAPAPTTVGYVLSWVSTNGEMGALSAAGLGDVTTSQLLGASNFLWLSLTNYDNFSSNYLYGFMTNSLARTTNGLWLEITNRITRTTNGLWAIIQAGTNSAVLAASNITVLATNSTTSDLQARINATNTLYLLRFAADEAAIVSFMAVDDVNIVDPTLFFISDGISDLWHVDVSTGLDGSSNPNLISRIGGAETLTSKTLTSPTINGGTRNGGTINSATINTPAINGGTISSPTITTPTFSSGIIGGSNINTRFDVHNGSRTVLRWEPISTASYGSSYSNTVRIFQPVADAATSREWNWGLFSETSLDYRYDANSVARLGDLNTTTNGHFFPSNTFSAASIAAGLTNGGYWAGVISNAFQFAWMSNNVLKWKIASP